MQLVGPNFPRKPKILVADDDWLNRDVLETYLRHMDAEVISALDGLQALELATGDPPDLIIMDLQMPRMDGAEACRHIKAHPATQFVPVVMVTALEGDEEKRRAIEAGVDDFITKPYSSILLMTRVRALLKIKHLNDELQARNRLLRRVLNRYVAEEVAEIILTNPEKHLRLGGETREVTVLFADIRGFTEFTEKHTAAQVVEALNQVFPPLTQVIFKHHGTFDKYLGDAIMAFYGAPLSGPDDALRAVHTALEMRAVFEALLAAQPEGLRGLGLGMGLHTGEVTVGNIGSETVMDYTVIGDTVNVARRLTEDARASEILISEATYRLVREHVAAERLEARPIRGRTEPVMVYALTGNRAASPRGPRPA
jgi:class 3 adenylate cyclase